MKSLALIICLFATGVEARGKNDLAELDFSKCWPVLWRGR